MSISLYATSAGVFVRMLTNLQAILAKAEAYATERKFNPDNYVGMRLAPDMHPLAFQIQSATDRSKLYLARVSGVAAPRVATMPGLPSGRWTSQTHPEPNSPSAIRENSSRNRAMSPYCRASSSARRPSGSPPPRGDRQVQ